MYKIIDLNGFSHEYPLTSIHRLCDTFEVCGGPFIVWAPDDERTDC